MSMMINAAALIPSTTRQFLGGTMQLANNGLNSNVPQTGADLSIPDMFQALQGSLPMGGQQPTFNPLDKPDNPFNILDSRQLYNIDPMTAVNLATAIGGLPPQQAQNNRPGLLGPDILNNITPMNAIALAQALAGPIIAPLQQNGLMA